MKSLGLALICLTAAFPLKAQNKIRHVGAVMLSADSVIKTEIVTHEHEKDFFLVAVHHETKTDWSLQCYDSSAQLIAQTLIKKGEHERILYTRTHQHILYILSAVSDKLYHIRVWEPSSGLVEFKYENALRMSIDFFEPLSPTSFVMAGEARGRPAAILFRPLQTPDVRVLPMVSQINGKVVELHTNPTNGMIGVALKGTGGNAKFKSFYLRFDSEASLLAQTVLQESYQFSLNTMRTALLSWENTWLIATYGIDKSGNSQGLCAISLQEEESPIIYPHDFGDWQLFFAHYAEKTRQKLKQKISSYRKKGKIYPIGNRVFLHRPIVLNDTLYVSGEIYDFARGNTTGYRYNPYTSRMSMSANYWEGHPLYAPPPVNQYQPDLYRFKQFFSATFSLDGKKLNDNQIQMHDHTALELRPNALMLHRGDSICLICRTEKEIKATCTPKNVYNEKNETLIPDMIKEEKYTTIDCLPYYKQQSMITVVQSKVGKKRKWIISVWEL